MLRKWSNPVFFPGFKGSAAIMNDTVTVQTRKIMTNRLLQWKQMVINILHPGKATVPTTEIRGKKTSQNVQHHTRCHLCICILNPFRWWQDNWLWHDLWLLGLHKEKWTQRLARHRLYKKKKTSRKQQKNTRTEWRKVRGLQRPMLVLAKKEMEMGWQKE